MKSSVQGRPYTIFGYKGKQVRDNIHSWDVVNAFYQYYLNPRPGAVYNLGGGRSNSISVLEAIRHIEGLLGREVSYSVSASNRRGDHICYISDLTRLKADYPNWSITRPLEQILGEMVAFELAALEEGGGAHGQ